MRYPEIISCPGTQVLRVALFIGTLSLIWPFLVAGIEWQPMADMAPGDRDKLMASPEVQTELKNFDARKVAGALKDWGGAIGLSALARAPAHARPGRLRAICPV